MNEPTFMITEIIGCKRPKDSMWSDLYFYQIDIRPAKWPEGIHSCVLSSPDDLLRLHLAKILGVSENRHMAWVVCAELPPSQSFVGMVDHWDPLVFRMFEAFEGDS